MRRYGAFEVARERRPAATRPRFPTPSSTDVARGPLRPRLHARADARRAERRARCRRPTGDAEGRRPVGVDGRRRGRCAASRRRRGRLEFYSTHARATGAGPSTRCPTYIRSHVHPERARRRARCRSSRPSGCRCRSTRGARTRSGSTRSRTRTRSGSHPTDAERLGVDDRRPRARRDRDRPLRRQGLGHRGHPPGRRRLHPPHGPLEDRRSDGQRADDGDGRASTRDGTRRGRLPAREGRRARSSPPTPTPRASGGRTPACTRTSTFPVQPDPISGMHCWHQAVRVRKAEPGDRYGDIVGRHREGPRRSTRSGSSTRPARDPRLARRHAAARTGCCGRSSPGARRTGCRRTAVCRSDRAPGAASRRPGVLLRGARWSA